MTKTHIVTGTFNVHLMVTCHIQPLRCLTAISGTSTVWMCWEEGLTLASSLTCFQSIVIGVLEVTCGMLIVFVNYYIYFNQSFQDEQVG